MPAEHQQGNPVYVLGDFVVARDERDGQDADGRLSSDRGCLGPLHWPLSLYDPSLLAGTGSHALQKQPAFASDFSLGHHVCLERMLYCGSVDSCAGDCFGNHVHGALDREDAVGAIARGTRRIPAMVRGSGRFRRGIDHHSTGY